MQMYLSDYYVTSMLEAAFHDDLLVRTEPFPLGTSGLNAALFLCGGIYSYGWSAGQECQATARATGIAPELRTTKEFGLMVVAQIAIDIECKK